MGMLATRLAEAIERGATGGHAFFDTRIVETSSGHEYAISNWSAARGRWNISQGLKRSDGTVSATRHESARNQLYMARGRRHKFRFKDWADFSCLRANGRLVQLTTTTFRLAKVYGAEVAYEYVRALTRPVPLSEQIWINGIAQVRGVDYTVDNETGIVTSSVSWAAATREMACEFDVPVRFDVDRVNARIEHRRPDGAMLIRWEDIDLVEVRE